MARTLIRKNPSNFKTLPLHVEATPDGLIYKSIGMPLNFAQTLQRRKAIQVADPERFVAELANLGVSVRLTLHWQNRDYWVLVRQRRQDRGDVVLKLISGYVPAQELNIPLHTAIQEVAEECLLETPEGWLGGRFNDTWLPAPYAAALHYREALPVQLTPESGAARPVHCGNLTLLERPRAYVHLPTASLQLIYDLRLQVPKEAKSLSLFHVDERLEGDQLVARLNRKRPDLYLMPLQDGQPLAELYTLKKDQLTPASTRGLYLAESFARQEGWVVKEERVRWKEWVKQQGLVEPKAEQASHLRRFSEKAKQLLQRARTSLNK
ncbi:metal ABC transporter ATPase [Pseudomonas entomophila]|uniref:metal ABC transporter ATPase n=1 Tax=Pseudomonas entomophila TaxID=312306 RepID=UPI0023D8C0F3|nr:metal ABC transporter ATPase [Pseudomonas entomophila]MDF0733869.1 metal ABC transporter ATPase [Pseudomonas entomophila]